MYNFLIIIMLSLSCYFLVRLLRLAGIVETILAFFLFSTAHIVLIGYLLSSLNRLRNLMYWSAMSLLLACVSFLIVIVIRHDEKIFPRIELNFFADAIASVRSWYVRDTTLFEKLLLTPLLSTVLLLSAANLVVVIFTAPGNWDSVTYHLARIAYFLQHNNLNYFNANYWAQVVHPKNSALLILFTYLVSGRNENLTQLVQFVSYGVAVSAVYAISRKLGRSKNQSIFAAMVSALLTSWLMEATTAQNDLTLTAYVGTIVYFLFAYRETGQRKYLGLSALGIGFFLGVKASSFLVLPSIAMIVLYVFLSRRTDVRHRRRDFLLFLGGVSVAISLFALPAGYVENYKHFGSIVGPRGVGEIHTFEGKPAGYILSNGSRNLLRFGFDFLSLDGLPRIGPVVRVQTWLRFVPENIVRGLNVDLETPEATRAPFEFQKIPKAHEDASSWGVFGFSLVWVVVLLSLIGVIKSTDAKILALAFVVFFFLESYEGPYDPWRGRYFITGAIFAVPIVGFSLPTKMPAIRAYLLFVVLLGCIAAFSAVVLRNDGPLISVNYRGKRIESIFAMNRIQQLTRGNVTYYEPAAAFDRLVPAHATVAVYLGGDSCEYALFGQRLTRTIIPIRPFNKGLQPIPAEAGFLLYTAKYSPCVLPGDIYLGADWYLRRLTAHNRKCPAL